MNGWTFEERANQAIVSWAESIAWYDGMIYMGHTMTRIDDGYRLIVRAQKKNGKQYIKMVHSRTPAGCVALFNQSLTKRGIAQWAKDKYAK